jgi:hypothetical protein
MRVTKHDKPRRPLGTSNAKANVGKRSADLLVMMFNCLLHSKGEALRQIDISECHSKALGVLDQPSVPGLRHADDSLYKVADHWLLNNLSFTRNVHCTLPGFGEYYGSAPDELALSFTNIKINCDFHYRCDFVNTATSLVQSITSFVSRLKPNCQMTIAFLRIEEGHWKSGFDDLRGSALWIELGNLACAAHKHHQHVTLETCGEIPMRGCRVITKVLRQPITDFMPEAYKAEIAKVEAKA